MKLAWIAHLAWGGSVAFAAPEPECSTVEEVSGIVLNELMPNPAGADGGQEWVEIHHAGEVEARLDGWSVAAGTSELGDSAPFPAVTLGAGGFVVVAAVELSFADVVAGGFTLGNAGSDADAVELRDCRGAVADRIVYGAPNDDGWLDEDGEIASDLAPSPPEGATIGRVPDGADGNLADAVRILATPTPGDPNDAGPPCVPSLGAVVINEILPDAEGSDEGWEFVELFHAGAGDAPLGGWTLEVATSTFGTALAFGEGAVVRPGTFHLVGGAQVAGTHTRWEANLGNGTGTDAVRLLDCAGVVVDTVLYGEDANVDLLPDDRGRTGGSYGDPDAGVALARGVDGADTDLAADWKLDPRPTPGASNAVEPADVVAPAAAGCGGAAAPPGPGEGCAVGGGSSRGASPFGWPFAALYLLARAPRCPIRAAFTSR